MKPRFLILTLCAAFGGALGCDVAEPLGPTFVRRIDWVDQGTWLKTDTHIHSRFSDGAHTVEEIVEQGIRFGCNVMAITDHGDSELGATTPEYYAAIEEAAIEHPSVVLFAGMEWNVPPWDGDEHATVLVPPDAEQYKRLALFKARFDDWLRGDRDPALADEAVRWLAQQRADGGLTPVVLYNHPLRKRQRAQSFLDEFRRLRAINELTIGFSGAPGHQKSAPFGAYDGSISLMDRWDPAAAEVGGAWDALLASGLDVWAARAPSDFHSQQVDHWPGEFAETWLYVPEPTAQGVLRAFRAGSFFGGHGHIARQVELRIDTPGLDRPASMGETITVPAGTDVKVLLRCQVPDVDWQGEPNQLTDVEFIIVGPSETTTSLQSVEASGSVYQSETLSVPDGGLTVRARGRRIVENAPNLLFYTNPIRVQTFAAPPLDETTNSANRSDALGVWLGCALVISWCLFLMYAVAVTETRRSLPPIVMCGCALFFVAFSIYGSLMPINFRSLSWEEAWRRFLEIRYVALTSQQWAAWAANVVLFVPIGFFSLASATTLLRSRLAKIAAAPLAVLLSSGLSLGLEFAQLWFPPRTLSQNDVMAGVVGSMVGATLWVVAGSAARRLAGRLFLSPASKGKSKVLPETQQE